MRWFQFRNSFGNFAGPAQEKKDGEGGQGKEGGGAEGSGREKEREGSGVDVI
jgi:hypothetical protein